MRSRSKEQVRGDKRIGSASGVNGGKRKARSEQLQKASRMKHSSSKLRILS